MTRRCILLDELEGRMERKHLSVLLNLTDKVILIGQSEIPDASYHSIARKRYLRNIGFKFAIVLFRYIRGGSKADWVVIFWVPRGTSN